MGPGFGGLANYLVGNEGRVEWAETRNMAEGKDWGEGREAFTAHDVATEMHEHAGQRGGEEPMYHIAISFDPDDRPTDAELRGAVDRTLRDMGLEKHQALVVRHNDQDHEHVHVMVNRVGPEGQVWSPWRERTKLRASMEAQERELGVRWTGKNRELAREVETRASEARARQTAATERRGHSEPAIPAAADGRGFASEVRQAALADLKQARSWGELERRLEGYGLRVERRGQGAVVTDGAREAKLSSVSRSVSRSRLEQRLGPLRDHERGRTPGPTVERGRGADRPPSRDGSRLETGRQETSRTPERRGPGRPTERVRPPSVQMQARQSATRPGSRPAAGRSLNRAKALRGRAGQAGRVVSGEGVEVDPARVALRATGQAALRVARRGASRTLASQTKAARAVHRDVRPGGRVDRLVALVAERRALERIEARHGEAFDARTVVRSVRVGAAQALGGQEKQARQTFERALGAVYQNPHAAQQAFGKAVRTEGTEAASRTLAERPEAYGALRQTETTRAFGLVKERTTAAAQAAAPEAGRAGAAHVAVSGQRARAVAAVESIEAPGTPARSRAAAQVKETPAVRAVVARVERTERVLYQGQELVRERRREVERQIGRLSERIGRTPGGSTTGRRRGRDGAGAVGGKGATLGKGKATPERVQQALNTRLGSVGIKTVARAAKTVERGIGRE